MKTGIFGGSFDPPHEGHVRAARAFLREAGLDLLFVVPTGTPPHKALRGDADGEARLEMAKRAFLPISEKIVVNDFELRRPGASYAYLTLRHFREAFPEDELFLFVGTDMFLSFTTWKNFEEIFARCTLAVMDRDGSEAEISEKKKEYEEKFQARILLLEEKPIIISSSEIREEIARERFSLSLPPAVNDFIALRGLYGSFGVDARRRALLERLEKALPERKLGHVLSVEREVARLCGVFGIPEKREKLCLAALCHDLTKCESLEGHLAILEKYGEKVTAEDLANAPVLHALSAAALARAEFGLDEEAVSAVRWHTTGRAGMSLAEKLLWFADYTEETREDEVCREARAVFYDGLKGKNSLEERLRWLDRCLLSGITACVAHVKEKGKTVHSASLAAKLFLEKELGGKS